MKHLIDIHNHCLPNVDDGADSIEETLEILRSEYEQGIRDVIATPHYKKPGRGRTKKEIRQVISSIQDALRKEHIDIHLHIGCELFYSSRCIEYLQKDIVATLADSKYVLVEFYPDEDYRKIREGIYELVAAGYRPILAHVERYDSLASIDKVIEVIELGASIQVNADAVLGKEGIRVAWYVHKLLKNHLVHFVATDAHDSKKRKPRLLECEKSLEKKYGIQYAEELCILNPKRILNQRME